MVAPQGVIPPQALELEEAILGAVLIEKSALNEVVDILQPPVFYKEAHQHIYQAVMDLFGGDDPVDLLTVSQKLRQQGLLDRVGGDYYLAQLTQKVTSSAHIDTHARIVLQKYIQRELIRVSNQIIHQAYDETTDVLDLLDSAESALFDVANGNIKKNFESAEGLVQQAVEKIKSISDKQGLSGVPSGFTKVDKVTSGWQNSDLIILAARPGMGKTAFVLSMARNMAVDHQVPVAVFSLEMASVQLITRMIASETGIDQNNLRKGTLQAHEWEQLTTKVKALESAPLYLDDTPALSVFDLRAKCRRLKSQHNIGIIIIDYLQLMTAGGDNKGNREQEISTISRSLKSIAKELDVPVIALSQLSRAVETRGGSKRPMLSDLRESGAIEQDADIVSFIYRPEYYKMTEWPEDAEGPEGESCAGQAELIIAKHRNGSLENIRLRFEGQLARFSDLEEFDNHVFDSAMNNDNMNAGDEYFSNKDISPNDEESPF